MTIRSILLLIVLYVSSQSFAQTQGKGIINKVALYHDNTKKIVSSYSDIKDGDTINLSGINLKDLNFLVETQGSVKSVAMVFNGKKRVDDKSPWSIFDDKKDNVANFSMGEKTIVISTYSKTKAMGTKTDEVTLRLNFLNEAGDGDGDDSPGDDSESGTPSTGKAGSGAASHLFKTTTTFNKIINITKPGVYDFKNVMHVWNGSGSCTQKEGQSPCMVINASNVTIKNFGYKNCPDGVHFRGGSNIVFDNVIGHTCEDSMTVWPGASNVTIKNATFYPNPNKNERDKTIQLNHARNITFDNVKWVEGRCCLRYKTGAVVTIKNSHFYNCDTATRGSTEAYHGRPKDQLATVRISNTNFEGGMVNLEASGKIEIYSSKNKFSGKQKIKASGAAKLIEEKN